MPERQYSGKTTEDRVGAIMLAVLIFLISLEVLTGALSRLVGG